MGHKSPTPTSGLFGGSIVNGFKNVLGGNSDGFRIPSVKEYSQSFSKHPFGTLTELADPFGVDPLGRAIHEQVAGALDNNKGPGPGNIDMSKVLPPDRNAVAEETNKNLVSELDYKRGRRSAANTLFSGGQGILDRPTPASHVLLGS